MKKIIILGLFVLAYVALMGQSVQVDTLYKRENAVLKITIQGYNDPFIAFDAVEEPIPCSGIVLKDLPYGVLMTVLIGEDDFANPWFREYIIQNPFNDTTYIYVHDTVVVHDTLYDTVYISNESISNIAAVNVKVYQRDGKLMVEGAEGKTVVVCDAMGRQLAVKRDDYSVMSFDIPTMGAYLVKVGEAPARKIYIRR